MFKFIASGYIIGIKPFELKKDENKETINMYLSLSLKNSKYEKNKANKIIEICFFDLNNKFFEAIVKAKMVNIIGKITYYGKENDEKIGFVGSELSILTYKTEKLDQQYLDNLKNDIEKKN